MDRATWHLANTGYSDKLSLKRLKTRKLVIKDEIA